MVVYDKIKQLFDYVGEETNTECDLCDRLTQCIKDNNVYDCTRKQDKFQHFIPSIYFLPICLETVRKNNR